MLEAIIFDMDGVLVDSEYTYFQSKSQMLKEAGHEVEEAIIFNLWAQRVSICGNK